MEPILDAADNLASPPDGAAVLGHASPTHEPIAEI